MLELIPTLSHTVLRTVPCYDTVKYRDYHVPCRSRFHDCYPSLTRKKTDLYVCSEADHRHTWTTQRWSKQEAPQRWKVKWKRI